MVVKAYGKDPFTARIPASARPSAAVMIRGTEDRPAAGPGASAPARRRVVVVVVRCGHRDGPRRVTGILAEGATMN